MSVRDITLRCDTQGCRAYCQISAPDAETAAVIAAERYEWSTRDGEDFCGPCTRTAACCRCNPAICRMDETGDHCVTAGCAYCVDGCPATTTPCCKGTTDG